MEKKLYIQPSLNIVKVSLGTMLLASGAGNAPTYNPTESFNNEDLVGSRRSSLWEEEDEEE